MINSGNLRQHLLQACNSEPSIRHAVVALGALDLTAESIEDFQKLSLDDQQENLHHHHKNALRQYTTAIKEMRAASSKGGQDRRTTLLTCLVILCFEAWNGNHELAVRQVQTSLKLTHEFREEIAMERQRKGLTPDPFRDMNAINDELIKSFAELDVQYISFGAGHPPEWHPLFINSERALLENMPEHFSTIKEAEFYQSMLIRRSMRFLMQVPLPKPALPKRILPVNGWRGLTEPKSVANQQALTRYLSKWSKAYKPLWNLRSTVATEDTTLLIASKLKLHVEVTAVTMVMLCSFDEDIFDDYIAVFEDIVNLSELALQLMNKNTKRTKPKFSFHSQVVIPLHMVVHKCRDKAIRRRALDLCSSTREGKVFGIALWRRELRLGQ